MPGPKVFGATTLSFNPVRNLSLLMTCQRACCWSTCCHQTPPPSSWHRLGNLM